MPRKKSKTIKNFLLASVIFVLVLVRLFFLRPQNSELSNQSTPSFTLPPSRGRDWVGGHSALKSGVIALLLLFTFLLLMTIHPCSAASPQESKIRGSYVKVPLHFEANQGQTDPAVNFLSRGRGYSVFLTPTEAVIVLGKQGPTAGDPQVKRTSSEALLDRGAPQVPPEAEQSSVLHMKLEGANPNPQVKGLDKLPGKINYFIGSDRASGTPMSPPTRKSSTRTSTRGLI